MFLSFRRVTIPLAAVAIFVAGCRHDGPERVPVSGTVTYRGEPVKLGRIRFLPKPGTEAPISGAEIHDGKYDVLKGGIPVGNHRVEIVAHRGPEQQGGAPAQPMGGPNMTPAMDQYLPEKYNAKTELEISIPSGSGRITKDFEL
jgi:hypothetical protein